MATGRRMPQSIMVRQRNTAQVGEPANEPMNYVISIFSTELHWMGLLGQNGHLIASFAGHSSRKSILDAAHRHARQIQDADWNPDLRLRLESYAEGEPTDFSSIELCVPTMTSFQQAVISTTRMLAYGQTAAYGELAMKAGYPRAARAVGTIMARNRFPILIPCHRVLAAGGKLGGYGCPLGTRFKQRLLDMEASVTDQQSKQHGEHRPLLNRS